MHIKNVGDLMAFLSQYPTDMPLAVEDGEDSEDTCTFLREISDFDIHLTEYEKNGSLNYECEIGKGTRTLILK